MKIGMGTDDAAPGSKGTPIEHPKERGYDVEDYGLEEGADHPDAKPHPMVFLAATEELGLSPEDAFIVENAANGVRAAKAGEFVALGAARADDERAPADAGADIVVTTLDDIAFDAPSRGPLEKGGSR